jgi:hypothetical protein
MLCKPRKLSRNYVLHSHDSDLDTRDSYKYKSPNKFLKNSKKLGLLKKIGTPKYYGVLSEKNITI